MPKKYYLVLSSFPGCLPEDGFVVNTLDDVHESVQRVIDDYKDGWEYQWDGNKRVKNEHFEVIKCYSPTNKKRLIGAHIEYSQYGSGITVEMQEIDYNTAKGWDSGYDKDWKL